MREWLNRLILLAVLVALGYWGWNLFFPNPEKVIRKRLQALAREASFEPKQNLMSQAWNTASLAGYFMTNVQVMIDLPGTQHNIDGLDELLRAALGARQLFSSLKIELPDIKVTVAPGKESAVVNLTARGEAAGQQEVYVQELRLCLIKVKRDWLISEIVTVRSLSSRPVEWDAPRWL
jgi:hypothetical protein